MAIKITFDPDASKVILEALGHKIDKQGYITKNGKKVKSISNETIKLSEFGGIAKAKNNRLIYAKNNIFELTLFVDMQIEGKIVAQNLIDLKTLKSVDK